MSAQPSAKRPSLFLHSTIVLGCFWGLAALGMGINPQSFWKFFTVPSNIPTGTPSLSYYWDIQAYGELAITPQCSAFYPLWPGLIRLGFAPTTVPEAARAFLGVAIGFSLLGIPLVLKLFRTAFQDDRLALQMALLYSLSPLAIFRVIGYTESLFCFLGVLLLLLLTPPQRCPLWLLMIMVGSLAAVSALLRPTLPQTISSSLACLVTLGLVDLGGQWREQRDRSLGQPTINSWAQSFSWGQIWQQIQRFQERHPLACPLTFALILGTIGGYSLYGWFCWRSTGNFWDPFSQQSLWNKSLGLRPWLLFTPRSPLLDLWGLYFPPLLWVAALGQVGQALGYFSLAPLRGGFWTWLCAIYPPLWILIQTWGRCFRGFGGNFAQSTHPLPAWMTNYGFWFALYFAASHSAIVFLTQDRLVSLGRYIFAQPFTFFVLGSLYPHLDRRHQRLLWATLMGVSSLYLIHQWIRYGNHQWLG